MSAQSIWNSARHSPSRPGGPEDQRTPYEQDYDRLLFSTPVRRLADKTQVFPLEKNDSVRTRLTHSHEVSNLARSIGIRLIRKDPKIFGDADDIRHAAPTILATIGLAHDLGNPPFGHQGEAAISRWFQTHKDLFEQLTTPAASDPDTSFVPVPPEYRRDFTAFEGNAQALRLVTCLQNTSGPSGLNLTAATLAALMKYPVASSQTNAASATTKKYGYFASETEIVSWIRDSTGLAPGQRHPLTWIMEASDDIAYSVLDIEDAIKKGLISAEDLLAFLRGKFSLTDLGGLINQLERDFTKADVSVAGLPRIREIKATYLRTRLIERLVTGAANTYLQDRKAIFDHQRRLALLDGDTPESNLCSSLKEFAVVHAYRSTNVLEVEMQGAIVIKSLMDAMWKAISDRKDFSKVGSRRQSPRAAWVYSMISDSYRWQFEHASASSRLPIRYREMQLLTDNISGMTDGYAVDLWEKMQHHADA